MMRETPLWRRYQRLWGQNAVEDASDELDFHLSMRIGDLVRQGLTEAEARAQASREFGDVEAIRAELNQLGEVRASQSRRESLRDAFHHDIRSAMRALVRNRSFALVAIGTLGLGIGLSTATFSVLHAVLLRPLPFREPDKLVVVWNRYPQAGLERVTMSVAEFSDISTGSQSFEALSAASYREVNITDDTPERLAALEVSADFFRTLGAAAALGRTLTAEDAGAGNRGVVLSHEVWRRRYASDPDMIGRVLTIDKHPVVVVGVMPAGFELPNPGSFLFPQRPVVFLPLDVSVLAGESRGAKYLRVIGRLGRGSSMAAIDDEMAALSAHFSSENPGSYPDGWRLAALPLSEQVLGRTRSALVLLAVVVGFVMLIACINVSSLTVVRMIGRQRELAVRSALGAGRSRLVRQLLTENLALTTIAGALGVGIAALLLSTLRLRGPAGVPRLESASLDPIALLVALGLTILTAIALALVAARAPAHRSLERALRESGRAVTSGSRSLRSLLVITEIALACMVLIGAGLVVRSLIHVLLIDPGLRPDGVLTLQIALPNSDYPDTHARNALYEDILAGVRDVPGIAAAAVVNPLPLSGDLAETGFIIEGRTLAEGEQVPMTPYASVSAGYFDALGIALLRGRPITGADRADAPRVVIVDANFAARYWPGDDPVGKRIYVGGTPDDAWTTVVGVVAAVASASLEGERRPHMYLPMSQRTRASATLLVRTTTVSTAFAPMIRSVLHERDPYLPVPALLTMNSVIDQSLAGRRFSATLLLAFGVAALVLATIGLYGVIAYTVGQRTNEIGIRMALGARSIDATRMVLSEAFALALGGVVTGVVGALVLGRAMSRFLYGVTANDPATFATVALLLLTVAVAASWIPARRAARVPPLVALRGE
ncbi:MAG TPA: ABC transporter permease [Longimicrobiales bacterium]|nr:ABC transporter permease [Longimicrobiales bacterium]